MARKPAGEKKIATRPLAEPPEGQSLSLTKIVEAAVALLDEGGLPALTMRALADRLGAGVMSLYWHVANKDAVLDLSIDAVLAPRTVEEAADGDWRAEVVAQLQDWRSVLLRHPWVAGQLPRRGLGPAMLERLERLAATLAAAGVASNALNAALWSLWNLVIGASVTRASFAAGEAERSKAAPVDIAGRYPTIAASGLLREEDWDGVFREGLEHLLDGLVAQARG